MAEHAPINPLHFDNYLRCPYLFQTHRHMPFHCENAEEKKALIQLVKPLFSVSTELENTCISSSSSTVALNTLLIQPHLSTPHVQTYPDLMYAHKKGMIIAILLPSFKPRRFEINHLSMCIYALSFFGIKTYKAELFCINSGYRKNKALDPSRTLFKR